MTSKKRGLEKKPNRRAKAKMDPEKRAARAMSVDLSTASDATRLRVFRALSAALKQAGVSTQLRRIEVGDPPKVRKASLKAAARGMGCPDGFVIRQVCERRGGKIYCEERCVPE